MAYLIKTTEMNRRRHRQAKLARLRAKFAAAQNDEEKSLILAKAGKAAPWLSAEEFIAPLQK
ncbi:MAG: hypothetical protein A2901_04470 [Elusimicrobia bacterium RIFCSPLOWO2_01_FULL_54_10]|nr:MAG: hypothetical protein A2901_04470 [Elusimicrobia bacterium RIFCSPLOWO2_01_FULL_54_10]